MRVHLTLLVAGLALAGCALPPARSADPAAPGVFGVREDGYRGIWYMNQPQADVYRYKYSGGFATYPQQLIPLAIYAPEVDRTFFVYGGRPKERNQVVDMVSYFDHASGTVPHPVALIERGTNDSHFNPTLAIDRAGYVYVFANSHGAGFELQPGDSTAGKSYIFRSLHPYSIDGFTRTVSTHFSYSQLWTTSRGMLWLHTRYEGNERRLFWATSADGLAWSEPHPLARLGVGDYQISWGQGDRVATVLDYHPARGGLNARTNLYYLETRDQGESWTTVDGRRLQLPLTDVHNPALVHDFEREGLLVYIKDLKFDAAGHPVILYLTSRGYAPGPENGPRIWYTARWTGKDWETHEAARSDHNYDHGSLYLESDGTWRIIAPLDPGPQPDATGGAMVVLTSSDQGRSWTRAAHLSLDTGMNQTYARVPVHANPGFYAFWAEANSLQPSASRLYFATKGGAVFRLPSEMTGEQVQPERVGTFVP